MYINKRVWRFKMALIRLGLAKIHELQYFTMKIKAWNKRQKS